ncbi:MAG TPA: PIN domain-containing protein [Acidimicrobiales bacterium]|nr:PIN domain-containing protein [Acidimicrobiales bacterium]
MSVVVDTGVFVSAADTDEPRHADCAGQLTSHRGELVTTAAVVVETAWLIEDRLGPAAEGRFLTMVINDVHVVDLTRVDYLRCIELIDRYADLGLGLVDASIIAVAERHGHTTIATLNHRDFRVVRPAHCDTFELVP